MESKSAFMEELNLLQISHDSAVVDSQKLVRRSGHVDIVVLSLLPFTVKEVEYWIVKGACWMRVDITWKSVFRSLGDPRLEMCLFFESNVPDWQGDASTPAKATRGLLTVKTAHIADLLHELWTENGTDAKHPHHDRILRKL